jgi:hypothetical protein
MTVHFFRIKETETLRTQLEPVHFGSGIETRGFLVGTQKPIIMQRKKSIIMQMRVSNTRSSNYRSLRASRKKPSILLHVSEGFFHSSKTYVVLRKSSISYKSSSNYRLARILT